jgi:hypothetical protein
MRVYDESRYQSPDGTINFWHRIQGFFAYGSSWYRDMQAQQEIVGQMARVLDDRYVLFRNIILPGTDIPIPLVLVGPGGIWVMLASAARGVFRAKGESWLAMEGGRFKAARPNMVTRVLLMTAALDNYLQKETIKTPQLKPVLLCTNPGMHVDSVNPSVRVVLSDAMDRFISGLVQEMGVMSAENLNRVVNVLATTQKQPVREVSASTSGTDDDVFSYRDEPESGRTGGGPSALDSFATRMDLSGKQWIALAVIFGLWMLLLLAFVVIVLLF